MFVKGNTLGLWDVTCRMFPVSRSKGQHQIWPMNEEPPAWIWTAPPVPGLFRIIDPPHLHPLTSPHTPPEFLQTPSGWQVPYDSFIPLMALPSPPEPAVLQLPLPTVQWDQTLHPPIGGFPLPVGVDVIPIVPHVHTTSLRPSSRVWVDKRTPNCKVYFKNAIAVESTWGKSEDIKFFHGYKKPILKANQVAVAVSAVAKPTLSAGSRPFLLTWKSSLPALSVAQNKTAPGVSLTNVSKSQQTIHIQEEAVSEKEAPATSSTCPGAQLFRQIYCLQRGVVKRNCGQPTTCDIKGVAQFDTRDLSIGCQPHPKKQKSTEAQVVTMEIKDLLLLMDHDDVERDRLHLERQRDHEERMRRDVQETEMAAREADRQERADQMKGFGTMLQDIQRRMKNQASLLQDLIALMAAPVPQHPAPSPQHQTPAGRCRTPAPRGSIILRHHMTITASSRWMKHMSHLIHLLPPAAGVI